MFLELHSSDILNIRILENQLMLKCLGALNIIKSEISDALKMLPASIQCDIFATKEDINLFMSLCGLYVTCLQKR